MRLYALRHLLTVLRIVTPPDLGEPSEAGEDGEDAVEEVEDGGGGGAMLVETGGAEVVVGGAEVVVGVDDGSSVVAEDPGW